MPLIRRPAGPADPPPGDRSEGLDGGPDERRAAARALAERPDSGPSLARALERERDPRVQEAILGALARVASPEAVDTLVRAVGSDDAALRTGAMDALRTVPGVLQAQLRDLLADASADVRLLACDLARAVPAEVAAPLLCARLEIEGEVNVCAAAVETLAEIGDASAVAPLERCAARLADEPFLLFAIAETCRRLRDRPAGPRG